MKFKEYLRPASIDEALAGKSLHADSAFLAGGTYILSDPGLSARRARATAEGGREVVAIDISRIVPRTVERRGRELFVGAGATFQDLLDAQAVITSVVDAAKSMANRNIRNRATVGGNIAARKSCASLIPILLVLGSRVEIAARPGEGLVSEPLSVWLDRPKGLIVDVIIPLETGRRSAFRRWGRTACDISILTAAVSYRLEGGAMRELRIAAGGLGPRARLFPEIERLFEGKPLPRRADAEAAIAPLLSPVDDLRGSAAFKRLRGAGLIADALAGAVEEP